AQFGQEPFTSMEIVRGLRWAGDDTLAETLVELLDDPETTPDVALVTAWSLGELFDPNDRPRLHAAILKDVNVTLPVLHGRDPERWTNHGAIYQYRCYTNEFLFKSRLIRRDGWRHWRGWQSGVRCKARGWPSLGFVRVTLVAGFGSGTMW